MAGASRPASEASQVGRSAPQATPGNRFSLSGARQAALSILPIMMAPLSVQIARGCLEGVLQSRVLSVPASAGGPHQQGAVVGLRQTGQRLTSIPIPALMDGIPDRMRSPRVVGSPCTVIDAQMDPLIARFVVQHADRGPTVRIRLPPAASQTKL